MSPEIEHELAQLGELIRFNKDLPGSDHHAFLQLVAESDCMVTSWRSECFLPEDLGKTGRLQLLVHAAGSVRKLISPEIIASGVRTAQCTAAVATAVAQYTVGLIIIGLRNSVGRYLLLREGKRVAGGYRDLEGMTVGLLSLSTVGRQVPALLRPMGARIIAYDPFWTQAQAAALGVELVDLDQLFARADVLSVHAPLLTETRGIVTQKRIDMLKDGSVFINTARGELVDQEALFARCSRGEVTACLDVTTPEPLPPTHPAWSCPNVFITPHIAGPTDQSLQRIAQMMVETVRRFANYEARSQELPGEITPERYAIIA
jgi:phosphoglycerate dehydrogenase-like enzyme